MAASGRSRQPHAAANSDASALSGAGIGERLDGSYWRVVHWYW